MTEQRPGDAAALRAGLVARGVTVATCFSGRNPGLPCRQVRDGYCPLASGRTQAVVSVRSRPGAAPSLTEATVGCAVTAQVPVVVAGAAGDGPFSRVAAATVAGTDPDDVLAALCVAEALSGTRAPAPAAVASTG